MNRREFIRNILLGTGLLSLSACASGVDMELLFQKHFRDYKAKDLDNLLRKLEKKYSESYNQQFHVSADVPIPDTLFAYALDLSRCVGCRRCVYGCVEENNMSENPQIHWIKVLEIEEEKGIDFFHSELYYDHDTVPDPGHFYLPVACQQCENPPCVKSCPVKATWKEDDGIVVIDYNWCIGCRCCMSACPYGARHFNWKTPGFVKKDMNTETHYLGNRPRYAGVVEKCTFCIQRVRKGRYPKCVEVCPVGARKFGNMLDEESEVRYILKNKRVAILKEELNTQPKFFYFFG